MTAIADASGDVSAEWGWPVWVFIIAVSGLIAIVLHILNNPVPNLDPNELDTVDDLGQCKQRGCCGTAVGFVVDSHGKRRAVCTGCYLEGRRKGWWSSWANGRAAS